MHIKSCEIPILEQIIALIFDMQVKQRHLVLILPPFSALPGVLQIGESTHACDAPASATYSRAEYL